MNVFAKWACRGPVCRKVIGLSSITCGHGAGSVLINALELLIASHVRIAGKVALEDAVADSRRNAAKHLGLIAVGAASSRTLQFSGTDQGLTTMSTSAKDRSAA